GLDDHVALLVREAHVQPVASLALDVGGVVQPPLLLAQVFQGRGKGSALGLKLVDLPALRDVLADRVRPAQRERAQHHGEDRRPAGEMRPGARWPRVTAGWLGHRPASANRGNAARPAYAAASSSRSSIRSNWLYFATRSDLAGAPVFIWPQFTATA